MEYSELRSYIVPDIALSRRLGRWSVRGVVYRWGGQMMRILGKAYVALLGLGLLALVFKGIFAPEKERALAVPPPASSYPSSLSQNPAKPPVPAPRYDEQRGDNYLYISAVSDEDQSKGISVGNVIAYQYWGIDKAGRHIVAVVDGAGRPKAEYACKNPCKIIDGEAGTMIAFNDSSMIGAVFSDAINGHLQIAERQTSERKPPVHVAPVDQSNGMGNLPSPPKSTGTDDEPWTEEI